MTCPLTYTQHTAAFPNMPLDTFGVYDEIGVSLDPPGGGTVGELRIVFHRFNSSGSTGVELCCYGDGLNCLYDPRVQDAMTLWRRQPDPDRVTVAAFIAILRECGAVPSRHMPEEP